MYHQTKVIIGGLLGNLVESYDLAICYFLASELSSQLLGQDQHNPTVTLTLLFLAYLAKPIGAFFLGLFSDRYGRKRVLSYSILFVGLSTFCIGFIPTWARIGWVAGALFLFFRFVQSMALGSEYLNSASFLVESGKANERGFRGSWTAVGTKLGFLLACLIAALFQHIKNMWPEQTELWRIPFYLAIFTTAAGYYVRRKMPESLGYVLYYADKPSPNTRSIYQHSLLYLKTNPFLFYYAFFATLFSVSTGFFYFLYVPIHAGEYSGLSQSTILWGAGISLVVVSSLTPVFGWISDRVGRLELLKLSTLALFALSYPLIISSTQPNGTMFILMMALIAIPCASYYSASAIILTELFPIPIRCTALSMVYSVAACLASGVPPLLADYLSKHSSYKGAPAWIMLVLASIVFFNALYLGYKYQRGKNTYQVNFNLDSAVV